MTPPITVTIIMMLGGTVTMLGGTVTMPAEPSELCPGLCLHYMPPSDPLPVILGGRVYPDAAPLRGNLFGISHTESGLSIISQIKTLKSARLCLMELSRLGIDWAQDAATLRAIPDLKARCADIGKTYP